MAIDDMLNGLNGIDWDKIDKVNKDNTIEDGKDIEDEGEELFAPPKDKDEDAPDGNGVAILKEVEVKEVEVNEVEVNEVEVEVLERDMSDVVTHDENNRMLDDIFDSAKDEAKKCKELEHDIEYCKQTLKSKFGNSLGEGDIMRIVNNEYGIKEDLRKYTSAINGDKGGRPVIVTYQDYAKKYMDDELLKDGYKTLIHWRGNWYKFEDRGWVKTSSIEVKKRLTQYLQLKTDKNGEQYDSEFKSTPYYADGIIFSLMAIGMCGLEERLEKPCWISTGELCEDSIAFKNDVVVDIWKYAEAKANGLEPVDYIKKLTPDFFSSNYVDHNWDENATCELFDKFLLKIQPKEDNRRAVQRLFGQSLVTTRKWHVFFVLYGKYARNGKTTTCEIIKKLVGELNVGTLALEFFGTRFLNYCLTVNKINICGEGKTQDGKKADHMHIENILKEVAEGGEIVTENKKQDPEQRRIKSLVISVSNSLVNIVDTSEALWDRQRIIPFDVYIPDEERDPDIAKKIIATDMPGVTMWAIQGLIDIIKKNRIEECEDGLKAKKTHRKLCDHDKMFLEEYYSKGGYDDIVEGMDMYKLYKEWMDVNGYHAKAIPNFYSRVETIFGTEHKQQKVNGVRIRGFRYIKKININEYDDSYVKDSQQNVQQDIEQDDILDI